MVGVRGVVRVRPLLNHELHHRPVVVSRGNTVEVNQRKFGSFFAALDGTTTQEETFRQSGVVEYLDAAMQGFSATVLAYGQTGSGKTHSLMGQDDGLVPRAVQSLFEKTSCAQWCIRASFCEIGNAPGAVNECITDLLAPGENLHLRYGNHGPFVADLTAVQLESFNDALEVLREGQKNRRTSQHALNLDSSRTHSLFTLFVEHYATKRIGKLTFVDLAGSERLKATKAEGLVRKETQAINKSLFTLGQVILALSEGDKYVPYRNSKLTELLRASLGGNSLCLMITCLAPNCEEESLHSLLYATRAMKIENHPVRTVDPGSEIDALRQENRIYRETYGPLPPNIIEQYDCTTSQFDSSFVPTISSTSALANPIDTGNVLKEPPRISALRNSNAVVMSPRRNKDVRSIVNGAVTTSPRRKENSGHTLMAHDSIVSHSSAQPSACQTSATHQADRVSTSATSHCPRSRASSACSRQPSLSRDGSKDRIHTHKHVASSGRPPLPPKVPQQRFAALGMVHPPSIRAVSSSTRPRMDDGNSMKASDRKPHRQPSREDGALSLERSDDAASSGISSVRVSARHKSVTRRKPCSVHRSAAAPSQSDSRAAAAAVASTPSHGSKTAVHPQNTNSYSALASRKLAARENKSRRPLRAPQALGTLRALQQQPIVDTSFTTDKTIPARRSSDRSDSMPESDSQPLMEHAPPGLAAARRTPDVPSTSSGSYVSLPPCVPATSSRYGMSPRRAPVGRMMMAGGSMSTCDPCSDSVQFGSVSSLGPTTVARFAAPTLEREPCVLPALVDKEDWSQWQFRWDDNNNRCTEGRPSSATSACNKCSTCGEPLSDSSSTTSSYSSVRNDSRPTASRGSASSRRGMSHRCSSRGDASYSVSLWRKTPSRVKTDSDWPRSCASRCSSSQLRTDETPRSLASRDPEVADLGIKLRSMTRATNALRYPVNSDSM